MVESSHPITDEDASRILIVSSDSHAGPSLKRDLRPFCPKKYLDEFDEDLSDFRATALLDFFVAQLGPAVYNQGVRDACAALQEKLIDLEGEVYEPDRNG